MATSPILTGIIKQLSGSDARYLMNKRILLILPDQLFKHHNGLSNHPDHILLVEEPLYFGIKDNSNGDSPNKVLKHRQKLIFHRASMRRYKSHLESQGYRVDYHDTRENLIEHIFSTLALDEAITHITAMDPVNSKLTAQINSSAKKHKLVMVWIESQGFINTRTQNSDYRAARKRWFMADFYQFQRKRLNILLDNGKPQGGKWSFDTENRKKIPKSERGSIPALEFPVPAAELAEAQQYIEQNFPDAIGASSPCYYPLDFDSAERWLQQFLQQRFSKFGIYEDALVPGQSWLYHSILSPLLNTGLLTPQQVIELTLEYTQDRPEEVPLASVEGFIRQIIGWREFMRATYSDLGDEMRSGNHWQHHRRLPPSFYDGTTGITPIDDVIGRVLATGYCHHIERLMVLGGFMFLCEIDPRDIYRWFMTMFIDAYDWVMVPNVYAMSQHADGGLITTKPYFSGSAYLKKMGYDTNGEWCAIWDALYWRWIWKQKTTLRKNPRWAMMCSLAEKMEPKKMQRHLDIADGFLSNIH